jgi:paraquat-inducible protein B
VARSPPRGAGWQRVPAGGGPRQRHARAGWRADYLLLYFDQSLRGLSPGAPVDFRGIVMGEVRSGRCGVDPVKKSFRMPVTVDMYPARLGRAAPVQRQVADTPRQRNASRGWLARGFRGQLRTGNPADRPGSCGADFFPNAAPAQVDMTADVPEVPIAQQPG